MNKPKIVTLIGSTKFKDEFYETALLLTIEGYIVLTPFVFSHHDNIKLTSEVIDNLNELIRHKIDMSDEVFVINKDQYIGKSTKEEIEYAISKNKIINYLEPSFQFDENDLYIIRFALEHLHDSDISGLGEKNIEYLEKTMEKFGIKFEHFEISSKKSNKKYDYDDVEYIDYCDL